MNRPSVIRAVPDLRSPLRDAIDALAEAMRVNATLRADLVEREHHIKTLQGMLERAYAGDTERPGAP